VSTNIGNSNLSKVFTPSSLLFSAGPSLVWNILNYGQITNNVRVQDARFQEYIVSYQNSVLKAQQEVDSGLTSFLKSRFEVKFLTQSAAAAADALTIAVLQYKEGTADFTVVLIAEQNLYQAQNDLAIAQGAVPLGLIATYRAMGGGWQLREGHDFVPADTAREMSDRTNWGTLLTPSLLHPQVPDVPSPADERSVVRPPEW
jgi:outer membrane protein TolC